MLLLIMWLIVDAIITAVEKSDYLLVRIDWDYKLKTNEQTTEVAQFRTDWQFLLVDKIDK